MNRAVEVPPAKKHRTSDDDESDASVTSDHTAGAASICVGQKASATSPQTWKDADGNTHGGEPAPISVQHTENTPNARSPSHGSAAESPSSSESSSESSASPRGHSTSIGSDLTEESFLSWLLDQKQQGVAAGQLLDVLGLGVSEGVAVDDDELWDAIISMGLRLIQPSIPARTKLNHVNTMQDVVELLRNAKKVVVLAGAGISVSCGIPDFRSENGIYSRLGEYNLPNPQCMFDIEFFRTNPRPFFAFAKEVFPKSNGFTFVPSRSHYFLKLLEDKGKLLRVYSQNIDMLEHAAGLSHERSILCHGSFATATCLACKKTYPGDAIREDVMLQRVPMCQSCGAENGIVKPDIVFFGESLPRRFHELIKADENEADLVLVMGSSLKVNPVRSLVGRIHNSAPMILINREPVGRPHKFDVELLGYSDDIVAELCRQLGWDIPKPDPVLLGQSNLPFDPSSLDRPKEPLPFEFLPPSRHMFNGSRMSSPSSSEVEDDSPDSSQDDDHYSGRGGRAPLDASMEDVDARSTHGMHDDDDEHDLLMGSGSELLRNSTFEEDMSTEDGDM